MGMTIVRFALFVGISRSLLAQSFEAASVKPRDPSDTGSLPCMGGPGTKDPLHYRCTSAPISTLVETAYSLPFDVIDAPAGWYANTLSGFFIEAVIKEGATQNEFRIMLQGLLSERFHLKWHREMRQEDRYILTAPKPKFKPASPDARYSLVGSNLYNRAQPIRILARAITMPDFAKLLLPIAGKPVLDETNLQGRFDFDVEFASPLPGEPVDGPSIFAAFSDLGFSLRAAKRPVNVFVIDSADRVPTPN